MKVTRRSIFTGRIHTMDLDITDEQIDRYSRGTLVQDAFPHLSAEEREFWISGVTAEEWDNTFGPVSQSDWGPIESPVCDVHEFHFGSREDV